jgi:hypothetical protein
VDTVVDTDKLVAVGFVATSEDELPPLPLKLTDGGPGIAKDTEAA